MLPGITIPTLTGGVRKQDLILQGAARCPVSPFTVGVIHDISLILLCGKDTKRQGPGEGPGISNISRGNHLYLVQGFPCRFSRANICRTPEPAVCISVPVQTHTGFELHISLHTHRICPKVWSLGSGEHTAPQVGSGKDGLLPARGCTVKGKKQGSKNGCRTTFCNITAEQIDLDKNKIAEDGKKCSVPSS